MRNKVCARIVACILTVLVFACAFGMLDELMARKKPINKIYDFFSAEQEFDILFFGNSHMINAVYPMELWENHGIISYNLATTGVPIPTTYWMMRLAMEKHLPKLAVIDVFGMEERKTTDFSFVVNAMQPYPLSVTKIRAAFDLVNDPVYDAELAAGRAPDSVPHTV